MDEPAADGALIEIGGDEADRERCFEQLKVIEIEKGHDEGERRDNCQGTRIPTAAEAHVENGAQEESPETG